MQPTPPPNDVARAIIERRSWRVFADQPIAATRLEALRQLANGAPSFCGQRAARALWVTEPIEVQALTRVLTKGLLGKGNLWLRSSAPGGYLVLAGDRERAAQNHHRRFYNIDAAVLGELVALGATRYELGSCWMAALNLTGAAEHLGLPPSERIPAVLALGHPGIRRRGARLAAGWDRIARRMVSGRRRPMEAIAFRGHLGNQPVTAATPLSSLPPGSRDWDTVCAHLTPFEQFRGHPLRPEELGWIIEAMRLAPSAENAQTWRFVVLESPAEICRALSAAELPDADASPPGTLLVVLAAPAMLRGLNREQPFVLLDHPIALTHGMLLADSLGLAWSVAFAFDHAAVATALGVPADHQVSALCWLDREGQRVGTPAPTWAQLR